MLWRKRALGAAAHLSKGALLIGRMRHYGGKTEDLCCRGFHPCCTAKVSRFSTSWFCCRALCLLFRLCTCASVWAVVNYSAEPTHSHTRGPQRGGSSSVQLPSPVGCVVLGPHLRKPAKVKCGVTCGPLLRDAFHRFHSFVSSTAAGFGFFFYFEGGFRVQ